MDKQMSEEKPLMIDLFSGLGGASQAMVDRGWEVIRVDNNPEFSPDIVADVRKWSWTGRQPLLVWASPPCTEFSRTFLPFRNVKQTKPPNLDCIFAVRRIITQTKPTYWVVENVKGAVKWLRPVLGQPRWISNPIYLWGFFPDISHVKIKPWKEKIRNPALRAKIPYELSLALAIACESQRPLQPFWEHLQITGFGEVKHDCRSDSCSE